MRVCARFPLPRLLLSAAAFVFAVSSGLVNCGPAPSETAKEATPAAEAPRPKPADLSRYMSRENRVSTMLVEDHLLGLDALPGGSLAEYEKGGKRYQQFLFKAPSVPLTAVYLGDIRKAMKNPKFVAGFGGYFGELNGKPTFVFVKNEYVTGLVGLSQAEADAEGRLVAARIP